MYNDHEASGLEIARSVLGEVRDDAAGVTSAGPESDREPVEVLLTPLVPARPSDGREGPGNVRRLLSAAKAAGWTASATYCRGLDPADKGPAPRPVELLLVAGYRQRSDGTRAIFWASWDARERVVAGRPAYAWRVRSRWVDGPRARGWRELLEYLTDPVPESQEFPDTETP